MPILINVKSFLKGCGKQIYELVNISGDISIPVPVATVWEDGSVELPYLGVV